MIIGNDLTLDQFLEYLFSSQYEDLYPNNFFPTTEMENEFLARIHTYSDVEIKNILRKFLLPSCTLNADINTFRWIKEARKGKENELKILETEYFNRLLLAAASIKFNAWEGLTWILDLLPGSPTKAIHVLDAFFIANCQFLTDNWMYAIDQCSIIIKAKYIHYEHPETIFNEIAPIDFENLVARLYQEMGYHIELTKKSYDGGVDIYATKDTVAQKEKIIIQCKRYTTKKIGIQEIRNLMGVISCEQATKGVLVTSSVFSREARKKEKEYPRIELIDYKNLAQLLNENFGPYWPSTFNRLMDKKIFL